MTIVWSLSFSRPTLSSTLKKPVLFSFFTILIRDNIFSSKSVCVSQKNSSHNLLSPYIEGDLSLVPLEYYLIALSSIEVREPFIEKHWTFYRTSQQGWLFVNSWDLSLQYLRLSCRFSVFRLPRSFWSWARRDWKENVKSKGRLEKGNSVNG